MNRLLIILLCLVVFSCKENKHKNTHIASAQKDTIVYDYSNIVTNKHEKGFDWDLIDKLPVKEGDTVLFRIIGGEAPESYIETIISNRMSTYALRSFQSLNFYKTGENKFMTHKHNLQNLKDSASFDFYTYVDHGRGNPYSLSNTTAAVSVTKVNDSIAKFEVFNPDLLEYDIYFKINENGTIDIFKTYVKDNWGLEVSHYNLDTLINVNRNNKYIDVEKLQYATTKPSRETAHFYLYHVLNDFYENHNDRYYGTGNGDLKIVSISDKLAKLSVLDYDKKLFYDMLFKVKKKNTYEVFKIVVENNVKRDIDYYELDTLIRLDKNNEYIDFQKMQNILLKKLSALKKEE